MSKILLGDDLYFTIGSRVKLKDCEATKRFKRYYKMDKVYTVVAGCGAGAMYEDTPIVYVKKGFPQFLPAKTIWWEEVGTIVIGGEKEIIQKEDTNGSSD